MWKLNLDIVIKRQFKKFNSLSLQNVKHDFENPQIMNQENSQLKRAIKGGGRAQKILVSPRLASLEVHLRVNPPI